MTVMIIGLVIIVSIIVIVVDGNIKDITFLKKECKELRKEIKKLKGGK